MPLLTCSRGTHLYRHVHYVRESHGWQGVLSRCRLDYESPAFLSAAQASSAQSRCDKGPGDPKIGQMLALPLGSMQQSLVSQKVPGVGTGGGGGPVAPALPGRSVRSEWHKDLLCPTARR